MNTPIIQSLAFAAPAVSALVCAVILALDSFRPEKSRQERQLRLLLLVACLVAALCWTGLVLEAIYPRAFVYCYTLFFFTLMMDQVLIYRFVHIVTVTERLYSTFNRLHFLPPALLTIVSAVNDMVVPFDERFSVIYHTNEVDSFGWFSVMRSAMVMVFIAYNSFYPFLGLKRMRRYRRTIENYSADKQRTSISWLFVIQLLTLITVPVPLAGLLLRIDVFSEFWTSIQGVLPAFFVYPILCYNLLSDNYVIMTTEDKPLPEKIIHINIKRFTKYMHEKKPYLNPKLRITDTSPELITNRTYLSAFINRQYGMSFSRYINRLRLEELDRLRRSPEMKDKSNPELVLMAGFSNYRSYKRAQQEEDKAKILKAFE